MASIKISDLQPVGSDFFNDSESFMNELTDSELVVTQGGREITPLVPLISAVVIVGSIVITEKGPINKW